MGTVRLSPFLVRRNVTVRARMSTSPQRSPRSSPRRAPVWRAASGTSSAPSRLAGRSACAYCVPTRPPAAFLRSAVRTTAQRREPTGGSGSDGGGTRVPGSGPSVSPAGLGGSRTARRAAFTTLPCHGQSGVSKPSSASTVPLRVVTSLHSRAGLPGLPATLAQPAHARKPAAEQEQRGGLRPGRRRRTAWLGVARRLPPR